MFEFLDKYNTDIKTWLGSPDTVLKNTMLKELYYMYLWTYI